MNFKRIFKSKAKLLKEELLESFGKVKDSTFYFEHIEKYFKKNKLQKSFQTISDKTAADLDFEELFMFLDRTHSKVGQQYLYNQLRNPFMDRKKVETREQLIKLFMNDEPFRLKIQQHLEKLNSSETYFVASLFQEAIVKPPKWYKFLKLLAVIPVVTFLLIPLSELFVYLFVISITTNLGIHYNNKTTLFQYTSSIPQLIVLYNKCAILSDQEAFAGVNDTIKMHLATLKKATRNMSIFKADARVDNEAAILVWGITELLKVPFLLEPILLFSVLKEIDDKREALEALYEFIGEIDLTISVASLRKGLQNYCSPEVLNDNCKIEFNELYHPLIVNCVSNNLAVRDRSVLLTGSNMSGKTSFIRTVGISTLTAFTINTCFAASFSVPTTRIYSAIRITDDLMNDKSYYFEEVLTIKEMIEAAESKETNLFLLDEIFKGTNTVERIAAGKAVLSQLASKNNIVFVSTHDIELADFLFDQYDLYHFSELIDGNSVGFDYQLKSGKLKNRNAIRILEINGYPENVVREAESLATELDKKELRD